MDLLNSEKTKVQRLAHSGEFVYEKRDCDLKKLFEIC